MWTIAIVIWCGALMAFLLLYFVFLVFLRLGSRFYLCETLPNNNGDDYDGLNVCSRCAWATYMHLYINGRRTFETQSNNYPVLWVFDALSMVHHCCVFFCLAVINQTHIYKKIQCKIPFKIRYFLDTSQHQDDWSLFNFHNAFIQCATLISMSESMCNFIPFDWAQFRFYVCCALRWIALHFGVHVSVRVLIMSITLAQTIKTNQM